jgi:hypothetical protein
MRLSEVPVRLAVFLAPVLLAACADKGASHITQTTTETFAQVPATSADILWVVDNSISMQEEQYKVMDGAAAFVDTFERVGVDFHLGVITTDVVPSHGQAGILQGTPPYLTDADPDYIEEFKNNVDVGIYGDDQESGLEAAMLALTEPNVSGVNAGFLREEARLSIIVLSDEEDCSDFGTLFTDDSSEEGGRACYEDVAELPAVADIVSDFQALKPDSSLIQLSGIVGPADDFICSTAAAGNRYLDAVERMNGISGNICLANYRRIMTDLGLVAAGMQVNFPLAYEPIPASIEASIHPVDGGDYEVAEDDENGWVYSSDPPELTFHGDGVPPRDSTLSISYEY